MAVTVCQENRWEQSEVGVGFVPVNPAWERLNRLREDLEKLGPLGLGGKNSIYGVADAIQSAKLAGANVRHVESALNQFLERYAQSYLPECADAIRARLGLAAFHEAGYSPEERRAFGGLSECGGEVKTLQLGDLEPGIYEARMGPKRLWILVERGRGISFSSSKFDLLFLLQGRKDLDFKGWLSLNDIPTIRLPEAVRNGESSGARMRN